VFAQRSVVADGSAEVREQGRLVDVVALEDDGAAPRDAAGGQPQRAGKEVGGLQQHPERVAAEKDRQLRRRSLSLVVGVEGGEPPRRVVKIVVGPHDSVGLGRPHARGDRVRLSGTARRLARENDPDTVRRRSAAVGDGVVGRVGDHQQLVGLPNRLGDFGTGVGPPDGRQQDGSRRGVGHCDPFGRRVQKPAVGGEPVGSDRPTAAVAVGHTAVRTAAFRALMPLPSEVRPCA